MHTTWKKERDNKKNLPTITQFKLFERSNYLCNTVYYFFLKPIFLCRCLFQYLFDIIQSQNSQPLFYKDLQYLKVLTEWLFLECLTLHFSGVIHLFLIKAFLETVLGWELPSSCAPFTPCTQINSLHDILLGVLRQSFEIFFWNLTFWNEA